MPQRLLFAGLHYQSVIKLYKKSYCCRQYSGLYVSLLFVKYVRLQIFQNKRIFIQLQSLFSFYC